MVEKITIPISAIELINKVNELVDDKQDVLTAGTNITIENNVISSTAQESFFRGNWNNWTVVPTSVNNYPADYKGNKTPTYGDFLIVKDAIDYVGSGKNYNFKYKKYHEISINDGDYVAISGGYTYTDGDVTFTISRWQYDYTVICNVDTYYNGVLKPAGNAIYSWSSGANDFSFDIVATSTETYDGTWRFAYYGVWSTEGKLGWKPEYRVENTLPDATDSVKGIAKLYNTTGNNTDGAVDQATITTELGKKQDVLTAGNGINIDPNTNVISSTTAESNFRGRFANYTSVPTTAGGYAPDYSGIRTPSNNDYMVVSDASDYTPTTSFVSDGTYINYNIDGYKDKLKISEIPATQIFIGEFNQFSIRNAGSRIYAYCYLVNTYKTSPSATTYIPGDGTVCINKDASASWSVTFYRDGGSYQGAWRFRYIGMWNTDGKSGWLPEYQIEDTLPIATDTEPGITKLYTTTGNNTDGTMDQNSITTELGDLQDQIDDLKGLGRFLSVWNSSTGLPETNPETSPYEYKSGDYYLVGTVSSSTNYRPDGLSYTIDVPSTVVEAEEVHVNDVYIFDGAVWKLQANSQREYTFSGIAGSPYDNTNLANALNSKVDSSSLATVATTGDYEDLTNKPTIPIVNNGTLNIQVNGTSVGTFTANQSGNTTASITVPDSATWGNITGTLSNQTDLQNALDSKADADLSNINASASAKNTINGWGMPDYSAGVSWSTTAGNTWTAPYDCYISAMMDQDSRFWVRKDNSSGIVLNSLYVTMSQSGANTFPVPKGTVLYVENFQLNYSSNVTIYPLKGAS